VSFLDALCLSETKSKGADRPVLKYNDSEQWQHGCIALLLNVNASVEGK